MNGETTAYIGAAEFCKIICVGKEILHNMTCMLGSANNYCAHILKSEEDMHTE